MTMDLETLESIAAEPGPESDTLPEVLDAEPGEVQQIEQALLVVFGLLGAAVPKVREHYPPEQIHAIAVAFVPVANKHGWNVGGWARDFAPEIALAFALLPPAVLQAVLNKIVDAAVGKAPEKKEAAAAEPAA